MNKSSVKFFSSLCFKFICLRFENNDRDFSKTRLSEKLIEIDNFNEFIELNAKINDDKNINEIDNVREFIELKIEIVNEVDNVRKFIELKSTNTNVNINELIDKYENVNINNLIKLNVLFSKIVLIFKSVTINC